MDIFGYVPKIGDRVMHTRNPSLGVGTVVKINEHTYSIPMVFVEFDSLKGTEDEQVCSSFYVFKKVDESK